MRKNSLSLLFFLIFLFSVGCSETKESTGISSQSSTGLISETTTTEGSLSKEFSIESETLETPSEHDVTTKGSEETDDSISGIIKAKFSEWGIDAEVRSDKEKTRVDGYFYSEETNDIFDFAYVHYENEIDAKRHFDSAIEDGEIYDKIDNKIEVLDTEPRKQIMYGHFQYDEESPVQPDMYVLFQYGNEYFYMYGRGEEQVDRVKELAEALDLDIS